MGPGLRRQPETFYRWFAGGELNTCYNCLDFHVGNGRAEQVAIIYDSSVTGTIRINDAKPKHVISGSCGIERKKTVPNYQGIPL